MKFSELSVEFNGPSRDPLCSRPVHEGIKEGYLFKMLAFGLSDSS